VNQTDELVKTLGAYAASDPGTRERLSETIYAELRRIARGYFAREKPGNTLQATALVHEAFLRLMKQQNLDWANRAQVIGLATQMMRRALVDHARHKHALKEGGDVVKVAFDEALDATDGPDVDLLALDEALEELARLDEQQVKIVEHRYFGGLSIEETAEVLGISPATVKRDWAMAKTFLHKRLAGGDAK
jgi:RNA polymerase sigma factor (TIGR02999 family)